MPATSSHRLNRFVRSSLLDTAVDAPETVSVTRRRVVCAVTLLLGAGVMGWSLNLPAGDRLFYVATAVLALVWVAGGRLSGPVATMGARRVETGTRRLGEAFVIGLSLLLLFLVGAVGVSQVPVLEAPVQGLLDHARKGSLAVVAVVTAVNGLTEEYFFRGALFQALPARWRIAGTTVLYGAVTAMSGVPLLVLAALMLGAVVALQRRATGGLVAPVVTHLTWSLGMLFLLPPTLDLAGHLLG